MISFEDLNVAPEIKTVLMKYEIDFVFQPIFSRDERIVGYEALMRPKGKNILEFIEEMKKMDALHELELLTFFGATLAYKQRNYDELLSINSLPSEAFSREEAQAYSECFHPIKEKLIIEILEYTDEKFWTWSLKQEHVEKYKGIEIALDDFGTGHNDHAAVEFYQPHMIKLDRTLISGIDKDKKKQREVKDCIRKMHSKTVAVLAEGVETAEEYEYLRAASVDFFQGYYLARPS